MQRFMKPNKACSTPNNICCLDVESTSQSNRELLATSTESFASVTALYHRFEQGKVSRCNTFVTSRVSAFWLHVGPYLSKHRPLWIFAYNATRAMTLLNVWQEIDKGYLEVLSLIDGDPPVLCTLSTTSGKLIFCDLRNWYRVPFTEIITLSSNVGLVSAEPGSYVADCMATSLSRARCVERAVCDMLAFVLLHDMGNWRPTVAAQAMQAYRHRFGPRKTTTRIKEDASGKVDWYSEVKVWPLVHDNIEVQEHERMANYGGQDSCFFVGKIVHKDTALFGYLPGVIPQLGRYLHGPVYLLDVNSLYPYVMQQQEYPCKLAGYNEQCTVEHLRYLTQRYEVIADVFVSAKQAAYPVRHDGRVLWGVGQFWTQLAGVELDSALANNAITAVGFHSCYECLDLFSEYVEYLYGLKLEYRATNNAAGYALVKLLLNSLYGKFSQRARRWEQADTVAGHKQWDRWIEYDYDKDHAILWRSVGGHTERLNDAAIVPHGMPAISACVTAAGREYMRHLREVAGHRSVLYQGTDALLVTGEGLARLTDRGYVHDTRLGALRLVESYATAEIRGPQDYTLGDTRVVRGLPVNAEQTGQFTYRHKVRRGLAGIVSEQPGNTVASTEVTRDYQPSYRYGHVGPDGWVAPYVLTINGDGGNDYA